MIRVDGYLRAPILTSLLLFGCGAGGNVSGSDDLHCGNGRPQLSECFNGGMFSDCGGNGSPRLGCDDHGVCRWFSGGCAAVDFAVSSCPPENICCEDGWPFSDQDLAHGELSQLLLGWGREPWDRWRDMTVDVIVDPEVSADEPFSCTGQDTYESFAQTPCTGWTRQSAIAWRADTIVIWPVTEGQEGWMPVIEIDPSGLEGGPVARVCMFPFTDVVTLTCMRERDRECAATGVVSLSRTPTDLNLDGVVGTVSATFSTFDLSGSFMVTGSFMAN
jgi:hypothetical protein